MNFSRFSHAPVGLLAVLYLAFYLMPACANTPAIPYSPLGDDFITELREGWKDIPILRKIVDTAQAQGTKIWLSDDGLAPYAFHQVWKYLHSHRADSRFREDLFDGKWFNIYRPGDRVALILEGTNSATEKTENWLQAEYPTIRWHIVRKNSQGFVGKMKFADSLTSDTFARGALLITDKTENSYRERDALQWEQIAAPQWLDDLKKGKITFLPYTSAAVSVTKATSFQGLVRAVSKANRYGISLSGLAPKELKRISNEFYTYARHQPLDPNLIGWFAWWAPQVWTHSANLEHAVSSMERLEMIPALTSLTAHQHYAESREYGPNLVWASLLDRLSTTRPLPRSSITGASQDFGRRGKAVIAVDTQQEWACAVLTPLKDVVNFFPGPWDALFAQTDPGVLHSHLGILPVAADKIAKTIRPSPYSVQIVLDSNAQVTEFADVPHSGVTSGQALTHQQGVHIVRPLLEQKLSPQTIKELPSQAGGAPLAMLLPLGVSESDVDSWFEKLDIEIGKLERLGSSPSAKRDDQAKEVGKVLNDFLLFSLPGYEARLVRYLNLCKSLSDMHLQFIVDEFRSHPLFFWRFRLVLEKEFTFLKDRFGYSEASHFFKYAAESDLMDRTEEWLGLIHFILSQPIIPTVASHLKTEFRGFVIDSKEFARKPMSISIYKDLITDFELGSFVIHSVARFSDAIIQSHGKEAWVEMVDYLLDHLTIADESFPFLWSNEEDPAKRTALFNSADVARSVKKENVDRARMAGRLLPQILQLPASDPDAARLLNRIGCSSFPTAAKAEALFDVVGWDDPRVDTFIDLLFENAIEPPTEGGGLRVAAWALVSPATFKNLKFELSSAQMVMRLERILIGVLNSSTSPPEGQRLSKDFHGAQVRSLLAEWRSPSPVSAITDLQEPIARWKRWTALDKREDRTKAIQEYLASCAKELKEKSLEKPPTDD